MKENRFGRGATITVYGGESNFCTVLSSELLNMSLYKEKTNNNGGCVDDLLIEENNLRNDLTDACEACPVKCGKYTEIYCEGTNGVGGGVVRSLELMSEEEWKNTLNDLKTPCAEGFANRASYEK